MKIAYCVEGSADRAIIHGLRDRWCPQAELLEGQFRGGKLKRKDIPKECRILTAKGADLILFLRDANFEDWRAVLKADEAKCPPEYRERVIFAVCDRNAECWLASDPDHLAARLRLPRNELKDDPSETVKAAFGLTGFDKEQNEAGVANYVTIAPLGNWLHNSSFANFYEQVWQKGKEWHCTSLENLRERKA